VLLTAGALTALALAIGFIAGERGARCVEAISKAGLVIDPRVAAAMVFLALASVEIVL
jgi:hypothetical protein